MPPEKEIQEMLTALEVGTKIVEGDKKEADDKADEEARAAAEAAAREAEELEAAKAAAKAEADAEAKAAEEAAKKAAEETGDKKGEGDGEGEEPDPFKELQEDNNRLRQMVNDMARQMGAPRRDSDLRPRTPSEDEAAAAKKAAEEQAAKSAGDRQAMAKLMEYVTDEEADLLMDKPKEVLTKALGRLALALEEKIMRQLPETVGSIAQHHINLVRRVDDFYTKNKDLDKYRDFVMLVGTQIEQEHPDWKTEDIYAETAKVARARLGLRDQAIANEDGHGDPKPNKPALPGSRGSRKPGGGPQLSEQQKEMVDMINLAY